MAFYVILPSYRSISTLIEWYTLLTTTTKHLSLIYFTDIVNTHWTLLIFVANYTVAYCIHQTQDSDLFVIVSSSNLWIALRATLYY